MMTKEKLVRENCNTASDALGYFIQEMKDRNDHKVKEISPGRYSMFSEFEYDAMQSGDQEKKRLVKTRIAYKNGELELRIFGSDYAPLTEIPEEGMLKYVKGERSNVSDPRVDTIFNVREGEKIAVTCEREKGYNPDQVLIELMNNCKSVKTSIYSSGETTSVLLYTHKQKNGNFGITSIVGSVKRVEGDMLFFRYAAAVTIDNILEAGKKNREGKEASANA
jgi:hypothetical protein